MIKINIGNNKDVVKEVNSLEKNIENVKNYMSLTAMFTLIGIVFCWIVFNGGIENPDLIIQNKVFLLGIAICSPLLFIPNKIIQNTIALFSSMIFIGEMLNFLVEYMKIRNMELVLDNNLFLFSFATVISLVAMFLIILMIVFIFKLLNYIGNKLNMFNFYFASLNVIFISIISFFIGIIYIAFILSNFSVT